MRPLVFMINRFFMELHLFCRNIIDTVKACQDYFGFDLLSIMIERRSKTFRHVMRTVAVS